MSNVIVDNSYLDDLLGTRAADSFQESTAVPMAEPQGIVRQQRSSPQSSAPQREAAPVSTRRWESGRTNRLNEGHWVHAAGQPINVDLNGYLKTLRKRCCYEAANNPTVEGVIKTHTIDLFGPSGPTLKVVSDSKEYNQALERVWRDWWADPTSAGTMSGRELLDLWNYQTWTKGPVLGQIVTDKQAATPIKARITPLDPDRLDTPPDQVGKKDVALGVKRNKFGRPTKYYVADPENYGVFEYWSGKFSELDPDEVIHEFLAVEAGQVTGFPRLASCLQEIADLRDFDSETLIAARAQARHAPYWYTKEPEAWLEMGGIYPGDECEYEPGQEKFAPPGWVPGWAPTTHPGAQYKEFRHEKLRSLGRTAHMPLLLVLLSAEESNFSQSRIDVNVFYERGLAYERAGMWTRILNRLVALVARRAMLIQDGHGGPFILPKPPKDVRYEWGWEPIPQADPVKQEQADELAVRMGKTTVDRLIARDGGDGEEMAQERARIAKRNEDLGLPPTPGMKDSAPASSGDDESGQNEPSKPKAKVTA